MSDRFRMFSLGCAVALGLTACSRDPSERARRGVDALSQGNPAKATRLLTSAAERMPAGEASARVWNAAGVSAVRSGREEQAERAFREAVEADPGLAAASYNLGMLMRGQGRSEEAGAAFQRAAEVDPFHVEALEIRAGDAIRSGELDQAYLLLRQAVNREESARTLSSLAVAGIGALSVEERRDLLQRAVSMDPSYAPAQVNLAALLDQNRLDPRQALAHYEAFARLDPDSALVPQVRQRMQVMQARVDSGDYARPDPVRMEVEDLLRRAAGAAEGGDPRGALQLCLRANAVATRASRTDLRERALRAASTLVPDSARAKVGLARLLAAEGRTGEALTLYTRASALAPGWEPALRGAVTLAVDQGEPRRARQLLESAGSAPEPDPAALLLAGDLYAEVLNADGEARGLYRRIVRDFEGTAPAEEAAKRLAR